VYQGFLIFRSTNLLFFVIDQLLLHVIGNVINIVRWHN